ncbi:hypothetical protein MN608_07652 [Microdochium nivale]|nr:hypothetical protein MN608_07652 [Microdochium nivale]
MPGTYCENPSSRQGFNGTGGMPQPFLDMLGIPPVLPTGPLPYLSFLDTLAPAAIPGPLQPAISMMRTTQRLPIADPATQHQLMASSQHHMSWPSGPQPPLPFTTAALPYLVVPMMHATPELPTADVAVRNQFMMGAQQQHMLLAQYDQPPLLPMINSQQLSFPSSLPYRPLSIMDSHHGNPQQLVGRMSSNPHLPGINNTQQVAIPTTAGNHWVLNGGHLPAQQNEVPRHRQERTAIIEAWRQRVKRESTPGHSSVGHDEPAPEAEPFSHQ